MDSVPIPQGPPSTTASIRPSKYSSTCSAVLGLSAPEGLAEGAASAVEVGRQISETLGLDPRVTILGHIQRGGSPTGRDRVMAARLAHTAVEELAAGHTNLVVCYRDSHIVTIPIDEALQMKKSLDPYMYKVAYDISI